MNSGELSDPGTSAGAEAPASATAPDAAGGTPGRSAKQQHPNAPNMLPGRPTRRLLAERLLVRLVATAGIVGIAVLLGAILADNKVQGWVIGFVIGLLSVVLSAILWSSRQM